MRLILIIFISIVFNSNAQRTWSLEECFFHAMQENVSIKQATLSQKYAENNVKQSRISLLLPNASANISESFNFGNSVDPTTYQFVNSNTNSTSFGINASYGLFEGLTKINALKASKENLSATEYEIEEAKNNIKIYITNLYLQITIAKEVLKIAEDKISLTNNQYRNMKALVDAGVQARGNLLDIEAQLANDELNILTAENNVEKSLNQLKLLLQLDPYQSFEIKEIDINKEISVQSINPQNIAANSMAVMPQIKAIEFRKNAAMYELKKAKGGLLPSLSISGNIGTRYFSEARHATGSTTTYNNFDINVAGEKVPVSIPQLSPTFSRTPFFTQLGGNLSENISLGLNIPILNGWYRRTAVANAKINIFQKELELESKRNKINEEVFNAYTDLRLSEKKYQATLKSAKASNEAYNYANEKFKAGILNVLELETAKNRKINAQANSVQAKYELFFKKLILNYYNSGELRF